MAREEWGVGGMVSGEIDKEGLVVDGGEIEGSSLGWEGTK